MDCVVLTVYRLITQGENVVNEDDVCWHIKIINFILTLSLNLVSALLNPPTNGIKYCVK